MLQVYGTNKLTIKQYSKLCFELLENFGKQFSTVRQKLGKNSTELDYAVKKAINDPLSFTNLIEPFTSTYKKMLTTMSNDQDLHCHINTFLRPLQDSYKLYGHLTRFPIEYGNIEIEALPNLDNVHCESNIVNKFPFIDFLDTNYIGVSKLSCGYCHPYLEKKGYMHRGTHGVCDEGWNLQSPQLDNFKKSIQSIRTLDQKNIPTQHRRLSTDDFEENILVSLVEGEEKKLNGLKILGDLVNVSNISTSLVGSAYNNETIHLPLAGDIPYPAEGV
ncbi:hypothetical protein [Candidatus Tisiphia endosymbiont of Micropterix aruncella]|uniref:hypothetical protein n=1 Tax=Candidatus Tisiphia endosymbiont of Micropterix aruncella TaxID=3066271 RepID=UPI003AA9205B